MCNEDGILDINEFQDSTRIDLSLIPRVCNISFILHFLQNCKDYLLIKQLFHEITKNNY